MPNWLSNFARNKSYSHSTGFESMKYVRMNGHGDGFSLVLCGGSKVLEVKPGEMNDEGVASDAVETAQYLKFQHCEMSTRYNGRYEVELF